MVESARVSRALTVIFPLISVKILTDNGFSERSWKMALHSGADILNADYLPEAVLHFDGHLAALGQRTQQDAEH